MTAKQLADKALSLLGYTETSGSSSGERYDDAAKNAVNSVYSDLFYTYSDEGFIPITDMSVQIRLPERLVNDVMPYGVAAFIATALSDGEKQQFFSDLYNQKRKGIGKEAFIKDVVPTSREFYDTCYFR